MLVNRYSNASTTDNLRAVLKLVQDANCAKIHLFASPTTLTAEHADSDGPETNFPLVAALATYRIPGITQVYVLFDGLFLTAARRPRLLEVQALLDAAQASGKAAFAPTAVPFTSSMAPDVAVKTLLAQESMVELTPQSRSQYFALLSSIPEAQRATL